MRSAAGGAVRRSETAAEGSPLRAHYRILGLGVTIESDSREFLRVFDQDFAAFRTDTPPAVGEPATFPVMIGPGGDPGVAYRILLREILARLRGFVVLHSGVVAARDAAVLIAGPPGSGKTTLALGLVEAGLTFFSDDYCPIERATGVVHPFPRSAWVAAGGRTGAIRPGKRLVPAGKLLTRGAPPEPRPPGWVFVLDPGHDAAAEHALELNVEPAALPGLAHELTGLSELLRIEVREPGGPGLRVRYPAGEGLTAAVRQVLERHGSSIRDAFRDAAVRPDFERSPSLVQIAPHEAAFALLGDLKSPAPDGTGPGEIPESPAGLMVELMGLLGSAECYRMSVGRRDEMLEMVLRVVGHGQR